MVDNALRSRWQAGGVVVGSWCSTASAFAAELIAYQGFDFVLLDAQHGMFGRENLIQCLMAVSGTTAVPLVRVAGNDPALIGQALDAGAHGVIVPMIETAADARRAVSFCRYPPAGLRSFGPLRAALQFGRDPARLSTGVLCFVMVETAFGVSNIEEIVAVTGVDGVFVGPADLAMSYGLPPSMTPVPGVHAQALATICKACRGAEIAAGIPCIDAASAASRVAEGYNLVTIGSDAQWITQVARSQLDNFAEQAGESPGTAANS